MHCFSTHAYISAQVYLSGNEKQSLSGSLGKKELALKYKGTYISSKLFTVQYFYGRKWIVLEPICRQTSAELTYYICNTNACLWHHLNPKVFFIDKCGNLCRVYKFDMKIRHKYHAKLYEI
jgi:hypothetical protein